MAFYLISIFSVSFAKKNELFSDGIFYDLAVLPGLAILVWIWGHIRYITEIDEYLRAPQLKSILIGLAGVMAFATVWGLMEEFTNIPQIPIFYVVPGFYFIYGLAHMIVSKSDGGCE